MEDPNNEPNGLIDRIPLAPGYDLQIRVDLDRENNPSHLNQDITNMPREDSIRRLGEDVHYRPL